MKAPARLFKNAAGTAAAARLMGCAGACALLGGCLGNPFAAKVDPQSPVAAEAAAVSHVKRPLPHFADIPPAPKDVKPKTAYGVQAAAIETTAAQLEAATAPGAWTLQHTDTFADAARQAAGPDTPASDPAATTAFANDLRKRATPPPPPKR